MNQTSYKKLYLPDYNTPHNWAESINENFRIIDRAFNILDNAVNNTTITGTTTHNEDLLTLSGQITLTSSNSTGICAFSLPSDLTTINMTNWDNIGIIANFYKHTSNIFTFIVVEHKFTLSQKEEGIEIQVEIPESSIDDFSNIICSFSIYIKIPTEENESATE